MPDLFQPRSNTKYHEISRFFRIASCIFVVKILKQHTGHYQKNVDIIFYFDYIADIALYKCFMKAASAKNCRKTTLITSFHYVVSCKFNQF